MIPVVADNLHEKLLNNVTTAILLINDRLYLDYINPAAEALLETSGSRVQDQHISRFLNIDDDAWISLKNSLLEGSTYTQRQAEVYTPSHNRITVDYIATPVDMDGNNRISVLLELQPIDRLMRIAREENLLSSQQNTRSLIRGLAHEIKNPLGGLRGAAQLLASELDDPELKDYTEVIISEADRLRNLVDRLLGPRRPPNAQPTNIHEIIERVVTLVKAEHQDQELGFERDYDPSIPEVKCDKEQIIQAVLNIVRNAVQAMHGAQTKKPNIGLRTRVLRQFTVGTERYKLVCHVEITDNGPGIPEESRDAIFLPMISGRAEGSGLGLSISQSILTQHRGLVECDSRDGLTRFSLYIPVELDHG